MLFTLALDQAWTSIKQKLIH